MTTTVKRMKSGNSSGRWILTGTILVLSSIQAFTQGEVRPTSVASRLRRPVYFETPDYNLKFREISFKVNAGLRAEFNDNITLREDNKESDLILTPNIGATMYWPITPFNALRLNGNFGYNYYLNHSELTEASSAFTISPETELSFDIYAGKFIINLHERPSLQQDPVGEATISNTSIFGRFVNTAGVTVSWAVNSKISLSASYDHTDFLATGSEFSFADFSQDQLSFSSRYILSNSISTGVEGAFTSTRYRTDEKADATSGHAGLFVETLLTPYTRLRVAGGYQAFDFDGSSTEQIEFSDEDNGRNNDFFNGRQRDARGRDFFDDRNTGGDSGSYYVNLQVTNQLSRYITQALTVGRESQLGITSQRVELWSARYNGTWRVNPLLTLSGNLLFDDGEESGARDPESFTRFGAGISTSFQLSRKLSLSVGYDFTRKDSNLELESYTRNLVFVQATYDF